VIDELTGIKISLDKFAVDRDYYFGKLREIEILTQKLEGHANEELPSVMDLTHAIQKIMYEK